MGFFSNVFKRTNSEYTLTDEDIHWNKFIDEICSRQLDELNEIQQIAVLVFWYDVEMNIGGHLGFLDCYPDIKPQKLCEALVAIGMPEIVDNYQQALLSGEEDDYIQTDKLFGSFEPILTDRLREYVELHRKEIFL